jgi:transposase
VVGKKARPSSLFFFVPGSLEDYIPKDHILRRANEAVDLSWVTEEVRDAYSATKGAPSVDPVVVIKLLIIGYLFNHPRTRELLRAVHCDLAMRWYIGYGLEERLPDHSSMSKIAVRWGEERFKRIFQRFVKLCIEAGLVDGTKVHVDATLIRANVSWESLKEIAAEPSAVTETAAEPKPPVNAESGPVTEDKDNGKGESKSKRKSKNKGKGKGKSGRSRTKPAKVKKQSTTDPEATMATSSHSRKLEPSYKQHTAVDDKCGVVVDATVTTGELNEGTQLMTQLDRIETNTGIKIATVTADAGYAHPVNYEQLEQRQVNAIIPPQKENEHPKKIPIRRFKYDARYQVVRCPGGCQLHYSCDSDKGRVYAARASDCNQCPLRQRCFPDSASHRTITIVPGYEALLRARRRKARGWDKPTKELYNRHRWRVEGKHGEAKEWHGLRRAMRRGRAKVGIQAYMTGIVMNLKLLVGLLVALLNWITGWTDGQNKRSFRVEFGSDHLPRAEIGQMAA